MAGAASTILHGFDVLRWCLGTVLVNIVVFQPLLQITHITWACNTTPSTLADPSSPARCSLALFLRVWVLSWQVIRCVKCALGSCTFTLRSFYRQAMLKDIPQGVHLGDLSSAACCNCLNIYIPSHLRPQLLTACKTILSTAAAASTNTRPCRAGARRQGRSKVFLVSALFAWQIWLSTCWYTEPMYARGLWGREVLRGVPRQRVG